MAYFINETGSIVTSTGWIPIFNYWDGVMMGIFVGLFIFLGFALIWQYARNSLIRLSLMYPESFKEEQNRLQNKWKRE